MYAIRSYYAIETAINNFKASVSNSSVNTKDSTIFIKQDNAYVKLQIDDILLIKSEGVYVHICTSDKKYLYRDTLKNMTENLPRDIFYQVHRSYIVNVSKIKSITSEYVSINSEIIPVSKSYKEELMKKLNLL